VSGRLLACFGRLSERFEGGRYFGACCQVFWKVLRAVFGAESLSENQGALVYSRFLSVFAKVNLIVPQQLADRGSNGENRIEACWLQLACRLEKWFREATNHSRCRLFIKSAFSYKNTCFIFVHLFALLAFSHKDSH
jgi:hypothetical protein